MLYWIARVATTIGLQIQVVAVGWQIYDLTSNPLDLGLIGLVQFAPAVLLVLLTGHLSDRYDRRVIIRVSQIVAGLGALSLVAANATGTITRQTIFIAVFVLGAARAVEAPTMNTLLPSVVPRALLPRAVAASATATQTAFITGPAIGGVLYLIGPTVAFATCATMFFAASVLIALVRIASAPARREPFTLTVLFAGIIFIRRNPIVLGALSLDMFGVMFGGAMALLPIFARDVFATGPWGLGLLRAAPAIGALAMSIVQARWTPKRRVGMMMYAAVAIYALATIAFGLSTSFAFSLVMLVLIGAADNISVVIRQTLVQLETPDVMRGRVNAVNSLFVVGSNQLGDFRAGLAAAAFSTVPAVIIGGVGTLVVVALWTRLFPALLSVESYDRRRAGE